MSTPVNSGSVQRVIDLPVGVLLIKGELSTDEVEIGKSGVSLSISGPLLDLETEKIIRLANASGKNMSYLTSINLEVFIIVFGLAISFLLIRIVGILGYKVVIA